MFCFSPPQYQAEDTKLPRKKFGSGESSLQCKLKYSIFLALQFISPLLLFKLTFCFSYDSSLPRSPPPYIHPKSGGCSGDCHASSHAPSLHPQRGATAHAQSQDCGCTSCDCAGYTSEEVSERNEIKLRRSDVANTFFAEL